MKTPNRTLVLSFDVHVNLSFFICIIKIQKQTMYFNMCIDSHRYCLKCIKVCEVSQHFSKNKKYKAMEKIGIVQPEMDLVEVWVPLDI